MNADQAAYFQKYAFYIQLAFPGLSDEINTGTF
jgi:hypothetical protein